MNEIRTGKAIPSEEVEQQMELDLDNNEELVDGPENTVPDARIMAIKLEHDGNVSFNLQGEFQVHEIFGALYTTIADLTVQQFMHPGLKQVIQSGKASEASLIGSIQGLSDQIAAMSTNESGVDDKASELVAGLGDLLQSFQKPGD